MPFILICMFIHALPAPILNELGLISDHVSDLSPQFLRGIEHVIFTLLLN